MPKRKQGRPRKNKTNHVVMKSELKYVSPVQKYDLAFSCFLLRYTSKLYSSQAHKCL